MSIKEKIILKTNISVEKCPVFISITTLKLNELKNHF